MHLREVLHLLMLGGKPVVKYLLKKVFLRHKVEVPSGLTTEQRITALEARVQENCRNGGGGNITNADFFILRENCKGNKTLQETSLKF